MLRSKNLFRWCEQTSSWTEYRCSSCDLSRCPVTWSRVDLSSPWLQFWMFRHFCRYAFSVQAIYILWAHCCILLCSQKFHALFSKISWLGRPRTFGKGTQSSPAVSERCDSNCPIAVDCAFDAGRIRTLRDPIRWFISCR